MPRAGPGLVLLLFLLLLAGAASLKRTATAGAWWSPQLCDCGGHHNPCGHLKPGVRHSSAKPKPGSGHLKPIATSVR